MAIDRTSKFAFVELREKAARRDAEGFLRHLAGNDYRPGQLGSALLLFHDGLLLSFGRPAHLGPSFARIVSGHE